MKYPAVKKIFLATGVILFSFCSYSQNTFQKTYGGPQNDFAYTVRQLPDSGFILAGNTSSFGAGSGDVFIIRTNQYGDMLWTRTYGGTASDFAYFIEHTSDNGFIITGSTASFGSGVLDVLLIKTDPNGDTLWTRAYGGIDDDAGYVVHEVAGGGFIVAGTTETFSSGFSDIYLLKTDANGNLLWTKSFGGSASDAAYALEINSDGNYVIAGSTMSFGAGNFDALLMETDTAGNIIWAKTFGSIGTDEAYTVLQTPDKGYLVGGTTFFGAGNYDDYLIKTDSAGNYLWSKTYGGTANREYINHIRPDAWGNFILAGTTSSFGSGGDNVHLLCVDASGILLWSKDFGGTLYDMGLGVETTFDHGIVICGRTESYGSGNFDAYFIKTDSAGNSGCHDSTDATITTSPSTLVSIPVFTFLPGGVSSDAAVTQGSGGNVTTLCQLITNENELHTANNSAHVIIYPDPFSATAVISVSNLQSRECSFFLYDVTGRTVMQLTIQNPETEIYRDDLKNGMYFYTIKNQNSVIVRGKLMIE